MKRLGIIGLGIFFICHGAMAGVSGFATNDLCNSTLQYISCVSKYIMAEYEKQNDCSTIGSFDVSVAIAACWSKYPTLAAYEREAKGNFAEMAKNYTEAALYDRCIHGDIVRDDTDISTLMGFLHEVSGRGYCVCKSGYYIQPRGRQWGEWGVNSECKPCPSGGTTDDEYSLMLTSCYVPAGNFSDTTGSGLYSDACHASFESASEEYASWQ